MVINKDTIIKEIISLNANTAKVFMKRNIHCLSCPFASSESLEVAAKKYNIDIDALIDELNREIEMENINE